MKPAAIAATLLLHAVAAGVFWLAQNNQDTSRSASRRLEIAVLTGPANPTEMPSATGAEKMMPARNRPSALSKTGSVALAPVNAAEISNATPMTSVQTIEGSASSGAANAHGAQSGTPVMLSANHAASNRKPVYPLLSRKNDEQGTVVLRVLVTADGRADKVSLKQSSGHTLLDESALNAVKTWRFHPATRNNQPIPEWYQIAIPFTLHN